VPVPGIKLGLANVVTMFAVWIMGAWQAVAVLTVRVILGAAFAGNFSTLLYSAAGGALAILTAILLKKILKEKILQTKK
jgi:heptaprenyl diphosphate synthase